MPGRRYEWDQVLYHPSFGELERSLHDAIHYANRDRTRGMLDVAEALEWAYEVESSYSRLRGEPFVWEYATATPTFRTYAEGAAVLGVVWWECSPHKYLIRIVSEDVRAADASTLRRKITPFGVTWGEYARVHPLALVLPALYIAPVPRRVGGLIGQVARALRESPNVAAWWQHYADLAEEAGLMETAKAARQGLATVLHLGAARGMEIN